MSQDDGQPPADPSLIRPYLPAPGEPGYPAGPPDQGPTSRPRRDPNAAAQPHPYEASGLRPYLQTGGRVRPLDVSLEIEAQVMTTPAGRADAPRLAFEQRDIVALCERPLAIAEVAARLALHVGVARVLASDLIAMGYLMVRRPEAGHGHDAQIIERVVRGLQAIR
jgi:hypothetical protein